VPPGAGAARGTARPAPPPQEGFYDLETFVDPERFAGTCYRAANWLVLGLTTGRGKDDLTHSSNRSCKLVLDLTLHPDFRRRLGVVLGGSARKSPPGG